MNQIPARKILVTGGTGYIGTHTCVELIEAGHEIVVVDNLSNSKAEALLGVERITGVRPKLIKDRYHRPGHTVHPLVQRTPVAG